MDLAAVGAVVRDRRRAGGLSQRQLAHLAGISRATLNYLENDPGSDMGASKLIAVLDVLGLRLGLAPAEPDTDAALVEAALHAHAKSAALTPAALVESIVTGRPPVGQGAALASFLEHASAAALAAAVRLAVAGGEVPAKKAWHHLVAVAGKVGAKRRELD